MIFVFLLSSLYSDFFEIEEPKDLEVILLDLEYLSNNPVDLNTADLKEFLRIPFLKVSDCLRIIGFREKYGMFESVEELHSKKILDKGLFEEIRPYITIKTKPVKWKGLQNRLRVQRDFGKANSDEYYTRTICDVNDYRLFLVIEKDPYETDLFDYYSAGLVIDEGKRKFALGKYNLDFGTGAMLSSVGSFFQGVDFRILTTERGIIPYTSTIENGGFFGAALSDSLFIKYCVFYSNQKLDGRIDTAGFACSFDESGNHIDSLSLARKDRIREEIFGYNIQYTKNSMLLSQRTYWSDYEPAFVCEDSIIGFYGKNYWLGGAEIRYYAEEFIVFAELVRSFQNRLGSIFGWSSLLPYSFAFNLAAKYFYPGFYAPKGAEAEKDYLGAYFDLSNNSRLIKSGITLNIHTNNELDTSDYDVRFNISKALGIAEARMQFRWLYHEKNKVLSGSKVILRLEPHKYFDVGVRLEDKYLYGDTLKNGIYGSVEIGVHTRIIEASVRYGLFETDSYSTRIYAYEPDLPGIINNRTLYGKGNCWFLYFAAKPMKKFNITCKYSVMNSDSLSRHIGIQLDSKL